MGAAENMVEIFVWGLAKGTGIRIPCTVSADNVTGRE
jgi:hypothetical protein